jgi:hypothetical protein
MNLELLILEVDSLAYSIVLPLEPCTSLDLSRVLPVEDKTPRIVLLSHNPAAEVPSAFARLTTQFGMGWGGTTRL